MDNELLAMTHSWSAGYFYMLAAVATSGLCWGMLLRSLLGGGSHQSHGPVGRQ